MNDSPQRVSEGPQVLASPPRGFRVSLVNMPFALVTRPSLALSLLSATLRDRGYSSEVHYLNLLYSQVIGTAAYERLSEGNAQQLGEHVFAELLYPERSAHPEFRNYLARYDDGTLFAGLVARAREFLATCVADVLSARPHLVGLTTSFFQKLPALALANRIKQEDSSILIVLGGAACEMPMGRSLLEMYPFVDFVFHGDADETFPDAIEALADGNGISHTFRGLSYRDRCTKEVVSLPSASRVFADDLPSPDFGDYVGQLSFYGLDQILDWQLVFETSRGCWWGEKHHCTFCGLNAMQMVLL